jgi:hypothetical protein
VGIVSPEHKMEIADVVRVMPNLTEQEVLEGQGAKTIRVRFDTSFCINSFLDASENNSIIKQEWNKLAGEYFSSTQMIAQRPANLVPIAIFPQILPEHGIQQIKERLSSMPAVWESNEQMAVDWCNEIHTSTANFATLFAPSIRTSLSRIAGETELDLTFGRFRGIRIQEVGAEFHKEAIDVHTERMMGQQVMEIQNLPEWASIHDTSMHPPTSPGSSNYSDLTAAQYLKKFQEDGSIGDEVSALFTDALKGQVSTSAVLLVSKKNIRKAQMMVGHIQSMFQEMIGDPNEIEVRMWPEVEPAEEEEEPPNVMRHSSHTQRHNRK